MFADQMGSGIGVAILVLIVALVCISGVLDGVKINKSNGISIVFLLVPFIVWFLWLSLPISNTGVGNFLLELCALFTVAIFFSVLYRLSMVFRKTKVYSVFLKPYLWLSFSVIVMRIFMPFVGK
jgi:CDP-diglyceride synthetase